MLVKYNPFSVRSLFEGERNLFDEFFNRFTSDRSATPMTNYPRIDVVENDEEFVLYAYLPGYKKEDVKLNMADGKLVLSGKRDEPEIPKDAEWLRNEQTSGFFTRVLSLTDSIDTSKIDAKLENGILEVHLKKREEVKPKEIAINIK